MALAVEEVLAVWREAERVLDELPDEAPERVVIQAEVVMLKRIYRRLTTRTIRTTTGALVASREAIETTRETLREARARLDNG